MLFSHICTPTHITGAEKLLLFLALELQERHDCTLVVPNEGVLSAEATVKGLRVIVHPYPALWTMYSPTSNLPKQFTGFLHDRKNLSSLLKLIHRNRPDFIVVNTCVNPLPAFAGKMMGVPVMWIITETIDQNPYAELAVGIIDRNADRIVGISDSTLKIFQGRVSADKLSILYPSWRMGELKPNLWQTNRDLLRAELQVARYERLVGYISSNIYPKKGLDHFIYMGESLCESFPHVKFLIVGTPWDLEFYEGCKNRVAGLPYADRFIFLPFARRIEDVYPAMDIVVVPSLVEEGFGMTALEALAFGKTLIAYRSGGLEELMVHTDNEAFLAPTGQWEQLAHLAQGLLNDDRILEETGKKNYTAVQTVFGLETYHVRLGETLNKLFTINAAGVPMKTEIRARMKADSSLFIRGKRRQVYMLYRGVRYPLALRKGGRIKLKRRPEPVRLPSGMVSAFSLGPKITFSLKSRLGAKRKSLKADKSKPGASKSVARKPGAGKRRPQSLLKRR